MAYYDDVLSALSLATRTSGGNSNGLNVGEYWQGLLFVYAAGRSAPSRLTPRWEESPNGDTATGGFYKVIKAYATSIQATGLSVLTLTTLGKWGRVAWNLSGTSAAVKWQCWLSAKGAY